MQDLKPAVLEAATKARSIAAAEKRTESDDNLEISWNVAEDAMRDLDDDNKRVLSFLLVLGNLDQDKAASYDSTVSDKCVFCGSEQPDFKHRY